ncbi:BIG1-domain-containing protein [Pleomassaria siparia CBS 279.74]|uniref:Protein BIG1 n=1 Tax=Pleomassaria siparia CBS 279.74 TaxID=1314801 RepID=A0A6G1JRJ8_9PLEO|nr:BIG1-domain-containing protein [Pleomassaria siparia CBS 279.74]
MAKTLVGALALASLPSAFGFRDTSPFFLFSTSALNINGNDAAIAQASTITSQVTQVLDKCPSKTYIVVHQEGVSSADYLDDLSAARLGHYMGGEHADVKSAMAVSEIVGAVDAHSILERLQSRCGAKMEQLEHSKAESAFPHSDEPRVVYYSLPPPLAKDRATALDKSHTLLENIIINLDSPDYTVIYTTTPQAESQLDDTLQNHYTYEMEDSFNEAVHMELKRDAVSHQRKNTTVKEGALFERYQYLSPGLFMGITAMIPLVVILYVGLTAITNLEVSYFAFSKEMGPAAQRRQ